MVIIIEFNLKLYIPKKKECSICLNSPVNLHNIKLTSSFIYLKKKECSIFVNSLINLHNIKLISSFKYIGIVTF